MTKTGKINYSLL